MSKVYLSKKIRTLVIDRAKGCCEYCRSQDIFSTQIFSIDHIIPLAKGGNNEEKNLAYSCVKVATTRNGFIQRSLMPLLKRQFLFSIQEYIHNWLEHYSWSEDFLQMIGISAIGRATIDFLKLNRKGVVNLRLATLALEKHPPDL